MTRFYCVLLLALLTGCDEAKVAEKSKAPQPAMPTSLVIQVSSHEGSAAHEAAVQFGELVKSLSQGSLVVLPQHPIEHTDERRVLAGLQEGLIDFAVIPSAKMTHIRPELELFNVPFIFSNVEQVHRVYRSQLARQLLELLKQDKLIGLGFWDGGFKQLVTNFPLDSVDDFAGKRFRIMESTLLRQQFEYWGAATTPIAHSLVAEAFQNGDINGSEESLSHIGHQTLEGKRVYMTNHGHQTLLLIMSEKAFYRLTPQQKNIISEAAKEASSLQYIVAERINGKALKTLEEKGVVYQPSPALMASLKQAYEDTLEKNRHVVGTANLEQLLELKQDWENPYPDKLIVALDAAMTGASAKSGLSIRRGIELALEEINANGGLLGKEVVLLARDNTMLPSRGLDNIKRFSQYPNLLAVFSGISSPVVLSEIDLLHQEKMLMLVPWAAATPITSNGQDPSYIFRVSVRDEYAAHFMLDGALSETEDIGLLMVNNGWGRSNYTALQESMQKRGVRPVHTEWFDWGEKQRPKNQKPDRPGCQGAHLCRQFSGRPRICRIACLLPQPAGGVFTLGGNRIRLWLKSSKGAGESRLPGAADIHFCR